MLCAAQDVPFHSVHRYPTGDLSLQGPTASCMTCDKGSTNGVSHMAPAWRATGLSFWSTAVTSARTATEPCTLISSSSQRFCCRAVLALGRIEFLHPGFHTERRLWPVGYVAQRLTATPASGGREVPHRCEVLAAPDGSGPLFRRASHKPLLAGRAVCLLPAGRALHTGLQGLCLYESTLLQWRKHCTISHLRSVSPLHECEWVGSRGAAQH